MARRGERNRTCRVKLIVRRVKVTVLRVVVVEVVCADAVLIVNVILRHIVAIVVIRLAAEFVIVQRFAVTVRLVAPGVVIPIIVIVAAII